MELKTVQEQENTSASVAKLPYLFSTTVLNFIKVFYASSLWKPNRLMLRSSCSSCLWPLEVGVEEAKAWVVSPLVGVATLLKRTFSILSGTTIPQKRLTPSTSRRSPPGLLTGLASDSGCKGTFLGVKGVLHSFSQETLSAMLLSSPRHSNQLGDEMVCWAN
jgi:hypothetical protein